MGSVMRNQEKTRVSANEAGRGDSVKLVRTIDGHILTTKRDSIV